MRKNLWGLKVVFGAVILFALPIIGNFTVTAQTLCGNDRALTAQESAISGLIQYANQGTSACFPDLNALTALQKKAVKDSLAALQNKKFLVINNQVFVLSDYSVNPQVPVKVNDVAINQSGDIFYLTVNDPATKKVKSQKLLADLSRMEQLENCDEGLGWPGYLKCYLGNYVREHPGVNIGQETEAITFITNYLKSKFGDLKGKFNILTSPNQITVQPVAVDVASAFVSQGGMTFINDPILFDKAIRTKYVLSLQGNIVNADVGIFVVDGVEPFAVEDINAVIDPTQVPASQGAWSYAAKKAAKDAFAAFKLVAGNIVMPTTTASSTSSVAAQKASVAPPPPASNSAVTAMKASTPTPTPTSTGIKSPTPSPSPSPSSKPTPTPTPKPTSTSTSSPTPTPTPTPSPSPTRVCDSDSDGKNDTGYLCSLDPAAKPVILNACNLCDLKDGSGNVGTDGKKDSCYNQNTGVDAVFASGPSCCLPPKKVKGKYAMNYATTPAKCDAVLFGEVPVEECAECSTDQDCNSQRGMTTGWACCDGKCYKPNNIQGIDDMCCGPTNCRKIQSSGACGNVCLERNCQIISASPGVPFKMPIPPEQLQPVINILSRGVNIACFNVQVKALTTVGADEPAFPPLPGQQPFPGVSVTGAQVCLEPIRK